MEAPHVGYHPANFGGHRHCGSGYIISLVVEEENSRCSRFKSLLRFIFKGYGFKARDTSN